MVPKFKLFEVGELLEGRARNEANRIEIEFLLREKTERSRVIRF